MTQRTLIYLHTSEPLVASWIVWQEDRTVEVKIRANPQDLSPVAKNSIITVLVPAAEVLLLEATLPKLSRHQLLQALPFALEEQLMSDVSELHFAIANTGTKDKLPVAVITHKKMASWLALFKEWEITPTYVTSAIFALPCAANTWFGLLEHDNCMVRQSPYQGFVSEKDNFAALLAMSLAETAQKPEKIQLYATANTSCIDVNSINNLQISSFDESIWLEKISHWFDETSSINLLQGIYQPKGKALATKKIWRLAAIAASIWLTLLIIKNGVAFFILHHQANQLEHAIETIYRKNFPTATAIVAVRERMEEKLKLATHQINNNHFLFLLTKIGGYLAQHPVLHLKNLSFRDNQLSLDLTAAKFTDLDAFTQALTLQGLTVKQRNAAVIGTEVKANLVLQGGAS